MAEYKLSFHDRQHLQRMLVQEKNINEIFNWFVRVVAPEMRKWQDTGNKNVWVRNRKIEVAINSRLTELMKILEKLIKTNQEKAWYSSIEKNDKIVEQYIKGMALSSIAKEGLFSRNLDALKALQNRVDNGLNLSKRIWLIGEQTKGHIELFLGSGIATGRSAEAIGRDFRQLLKNPDKRFHRIRDENGRY